MIVPLAPILDALLHYNLVIPALIVGIYLLLS